MEVISRERAAVCRPPSLAALFSRPTRQTPICPVNTELGYLPDCRSCPEIAITPLYYRNRLYKFGLRAFTRRRANRRHGARSACERALRRRRDTFSPDPGFTLSAPIRQLEHTLRRNYVNRTRVQRRSKIWNIQMKTLYAEKFVFFHFSPFFPERTVLRQRDAQSAFREAFYVFIKYWSREVEAQCILVQIWR